jgi:hypothetical protein
VSLPSTELSPWFEYFLVIHRLGIGADNLSRGG